MSARGSDSIPPIEIGSFVALPPDDSEFIGSASGAFFTNTVFRAFAQEAFVDVSDSEVPTQGTSAAAGAPAAPSYSHDHPGSAHNYLVAPETHGRQDESIVTTSLTSGRQSSISSSRSYGIAAEGLGDAPSPAVAQKLLELYFREWHPFFPFLHGPTFFDQLNRFYEEESIAELTTATRSSRLSRAVTFQCVFNLAAFSSNQTLEPECRIESPSALMEALGTILCKHDMASLQALLAAELYLTSLMRLRAASTIHGALSRTMYNSGFHRCPSRYVQLSFDTSGIRKRIFWCAYVLDRFISQALGHPCSIQDADVDVCIPGMLEMHKTVGQGKTAGVPDSTLNEEVLDHLPKDVAEPTQHQVASSTLPQSGELDKVIPVASDGIPACSPAQHHIVADKGVNEFILSYWVTYSRLLGDAIGLFHRSLHSRAIDRRKIQDLNHRIHAWWNGLPQALQNDAFDAMSPTQNTNSTFFSMLYNYLILLTHRPFLSLQTDHIDFRSSMQAAITAGRNIITGLSNKPDSLFLMAWPGTLSATWMAGLVLAFAGLLESYPLAKAICDIQLSIDILERMASRWTSARQCHGALKSLLQRLKARRRGARSDFTLTRAPPPFSGDTPSEPGTDHRPPSDTQDVFDGRGAKRPRLAQHGFGPWQPAFATTTPSLNPASINGREWRPMPVVEYTGPDFGFDTTGFDRPEIVGNLLDPATSGLFSEAGWDAYLQGFESPFEG